MELALKDSKNVLTISDAIFSYPFKEALVHQVVAAYAAGARQGSPVQKSRAEVAGSGKKPWRQKGTGRARSGSSKSPIWRSGGVTFAARIQSYNQKVNKKMYRGALKSIFSELIRQDRVVVLETFSVKRPKTKLLLQKLKDILLKNVLIIIRDMDKNLFLAARNLHEVRVCNVTAIDPVSLIVFDRILITSEALKKLEEVLV